MTSISGCQTGKQVANSQMRRDKEEMWLDYPYKHLLMWHGFSAYTILAFAGQKS